MNREMSAAVDHLYGLPRFTKKNSLAHTRRLLELLGDPCEKRRIIHVAGSNGKGSVCNFLYHMLLAGGVSAAMFSSPHLMDIRERFSINGELVGEEEFLSAYDRVSEAVQTLTEWGEPYPTFFEFVYAIAMVLFEEAGATYVILETGLGGRLDATNSFSSPELTVITQIALEHTEILGETIEEIAKEKAGILKAGVPVVCAADTPEAFRVIAAHAAELGCPVTAVLQAEEEDLSPELSPLLSDEHEISETFCRISKINENSIDFSLSSDYDKKIIWRVPGRALYQVENAALAIEAMRLFCRMPDEVLKAGLLEAKWPGRMQEVLPEIWFDGAHNPAGITAFLESARELTKEDAFPPLLLFSMVKEKDLATSAKLLAAGMPWDTVAVTTIPEDRGVDPETIAALFSRDADRMPENTRARNVECFYDCREAFFQMRDRKQKRQKLFCTGSLHFIGTLMEILEEEIGGKYGF
ncbi:MAG: bifunctional folylpolyglutamate synthase/dihydrofolate synthase [Lachnospiraceae bacterium]|nr:bifunctional folylpolyglutamate synthase/dihydrofolate synthase [Lachnospiraceae bacterium]